MITLNLPVARTVRVWVGELPEASYSVNRVNEHIIEANTSPSQDVRCAAVEMKEHRGGRILYGLLGGELKPSKSKKLHLKIYTSKDDNQPFTSPLIGSSGKALIGLPQEFSNAIITGALRMENQLSGLFAGELAFNCAAYDIYDSTEAFFSSLSQIVVRILNWENGFPSEHELMSICHDIIAP